MEGTSLRTQTGWRILHELWVSLAMDSPHSLSIPTAAGAEGREIAAEQRAKRLGVVMGRRVGRRGVYPVRLPPGWVD